MIYFTSDTHFGHSNVIQFEGRPFQTAEEMDEALIRNWNGKVGPEDEIYILGDFTMKGPTQANAFLERLQGRKYLIRGNHDGWVDRAAFRREHFVWIKDYYELTCQNRLFVLCHYPLLSWRRMRWGAFHLHGHQHNHPQYNEHNRKMGTARLDMGVDAWGMAPVSMEELLRFWEEEHRPDAYWGSIKPSELRLEMTCSLCPEQYDVFDKDGRCLGYLHLRGGSFTVNCVRPGKKYGEVISKYTLDGWHEFAGEEERAAYLAIARRDIAEYFRKLEMEEGQ